MKIVIFDHYGFDDEPRIFEGSSIQIEQQLRSYFQGALGHVSFGDLHELLATLEHMTGLECQISGERPARFSSARNKRPIFREDDSPWIHELDVQTDANNNL